METALETSAAQSVWNIVSKESNSNNTKCRKQIWSNIWNTWRVLKVLVKWNWWWNAICVSISLNFEIYFLELPWEIVSDVISAHYHKKDCEKPNVFLVQGFCTLKTEITRFISYRISSSDLIYGRFVDLLNPSFEITGYPCNVIGSRRYDLFTSRTITFALNRIFFAANENGTVKKKQPIRF